MLNYKSIIMRNIEVKARVGNLNALVAKAKSLSKENGQVIKQHDTFFNVPQGRLKLRKFEDGKAELIYYERPDMVGPKLSSFEKTDVGSENAENLHSVLSRALGTLGIVKKVRHLYLVGQTRVHVDSVEGLGDFMELEVVLRDDQSPEDGQKIAHKLMEELEINNEDLISGAYADMLKK